MDIEPSDDAKEILRALEERGNVGNAREILRLPYPAAVWWKAISKGAKSNEPYFDALRELGVLTIVDKSLPGWPKGLFETEPSLPGISQEEALALLFRFLRHEASSIVAGVQIYALHWDVLAAYYAPLRNRYPILRELLSRGYLVESTGGPLHSESGLRWPLTITEAGAAALRRLRLEANLPRIAWVERQFRDIDDSFPLLSRRLFWFVIGGGFGSLLTWIASLQAMFPRE